MKRKDLFPDVIAVRQRGNCSCAGKKWSSLTLREWQTKE